MKSIIEWGLSCILAISWSYALGAQTFEKTESAPWSASESAPFYPDVVTDQLVFEHISGKSKIHYVRINDDSNYVYSYGGANEKLSVENPTLVVPLGRTQLVRKVVVKSEAMLSSSGGDKWSLLLKSTNGSGGGINDFSVDINALYSGPPTQRFTVNKQISTVLVEALEGRTRINELKLVTDRGRNVMDLSFNSELSDRFVDTRGIALKRIVLNSSVYVEEIQVQAESFDTDDRSNSRIRVSLISTGVNPQPPLGCNTVDGFKADGETWLVSSTIREPANCPYGGNKQDIYAYEVEYRCDRTQVVRTGYERKGSYLGSEGQCAGRTYNSCNTPFGNKSHGETWWVEARNNPIVAPVRCEYGGQRTEYYEREVERRCNDGQPEGTGRERTGALIRADGQCNPPPQACRTPEGRIEHGGHWWEDKDNDTEKVPVTCEFGGNKKNIYKKVEMFNCNDGQKVRTGRERRGDLTGTEGQCNAPRSCGAHAHGANWSESTGQTSNGVRQCGAGNRGKQDVVYEKVNKKTCYNGDVRNAGSENIVKSAGTCNMFCGAQDATNYGVGRNAGGRDQVVIQLPGNTPAGTRHSVACRQFISRPEPANAQAVFICGGDGLWKKGWTDSPGDVREGGSSPACKQADSGR